MKMHSQLPPTINSSDREIVAYIKDSGCVQSFEILYNRFYHKVYNSCCRYEKNHQQCKDLAQDIFLKALLGLPQFKQQSSFACWLFSIASNHCIQYKRNATRHKAILTEYEYELRRVTAIHDTPLDNNQMKVDVNKLILHLREKDQKILFERYLGNYSIKEISTEKGLGQSAVKMRLLRARQKAKSILVNKVDETKIIAK